MIEINNLSKIYINEKFLKKIADKVLKKERKEKAELSIALVPSKKIEEINRIYRGKDRTTDVLSFPEPKSFFKNIKGKNFQKTKSLGEIIISPKEVMKNSKRLGTSFDKELALCLIHGILHLLGYDHEKNKKKAEEMRKKENYYLSLINI